MPTESAANNIPSLIHCSKQVALPGEPPFGRVRDRGARGSLGNKNWLASAAANRSMDHLGNKRRFGHLNVGQNAAIALEWSEQIELSGSRPEREPRPPPEYLT